MVHFSAWLWSLSHLAVLSLCLPTDELERRAIALKIPAQPTTTYGVMDVTSQTASTTIPATTGTVITSVTSASTSGNPVNTTVVQTSGIGSITTASTTLNPSVTAPSAATGSNIFVTVASGPPPSQISSRSNHPVTPSGIVNQTSPVGTNKFYANFFLGTQASGTWTHPYSVTWQKGGGVSGSWGLGISHIERSQLAWPSGTPPLEYFVNPIGIEALIFSAAELGSTTSLTTDSLTAFSGNVNLAASQGEDPLISFPLVQGMGFVTAIYGGATPWLQSTVFFSTLTYVGTVADGNIYKWRVVLNDQSNWLIYATPSGASGVPTFNLQNTSVITGPSGFTGTIQVAKNPASTAGEAAYDAAAGVYATGASLTGQVDGTSGSYTLAYDKSGHSTGNTTLLMWALPHHIDSFDSATSASVISALQLVTTTKGMATAVSADHFTLVESNLPSMIGFAPWNASTAQSLRTLSSSAAQAVVSAGVVELAEDINSQTDLNSMYYSGKALAKFAQIVYAVNTLAGDTSGTATSGLENLESAYNLFVNNTQQFPLAYDTVWKGAVSTASYGGSDNTCGADFGNTCYNDHHFHYGYFVYAAALIAYLDPSWLTVNNGANKDWVNMLVRDYANGADDGYFPFSRNFDWYHGHSWAHGILETGDGKDEESSSEDSLSLYGMKMWGQVIGDPNMEARGNLQLAVQARSLSNYFLYQETNTVEPANFTGNRVSGILFENKIDHTTYFGNAPEYIEAIHMIPLVPSSAYTRNATFVSEEWNQYFSDGRVDSTDGGWRGILYANLALIDPTTSFNWFNSPSFNASYLDGGASRTWYLAWAAGLGGSA
ncbi:MAG: hypothetical protein M1822_000579 [Bathelium mastoideum]|nr:MAG: hypothetical protein M1822_000579 [Bathelium mastoideum]